MSSTDGAAERAGDPGAGEPVDEVIDGEAVDGHPIHDVPARYHCAVLGSPVSHSLSPVLHRAGYAALGLDHWRYDSRDCDARSLPDLVASLDNSWRGLSITMPGKAAAAAVADRRSARVQLLGVANTLYRNGSGWTAENTDVDGVLGAFRAHGVGRVDRALLLGGGGTSLAVVAALTEFGVTDLVVAGRRPDSRAPVLALAAELGLTARGVGFTAREMIGADCDLVVSTVPAGAADAVAESLAAVPVLLDVVYHPWPTPLASATDPGRITISGLDMLLHQALRQFTLFTGRPAPAAALRDALAAAVPGAPELPLPAAGESGFR